MVSMACNGCGEDREAQDRRAAAARVGGITGTGDSGAESKSGEGSLGGTVWGGGYTEGSAVYPSGVSSCSQEGAASHEGPLPERDDPPGGCGCPYPGRIMGGSADA